MIGCPETPVWNCHFSLRNNPEERSSQYWICFMSRSLHLQFLDGSKIFKNVTPML
jgi:hypothetical protein